MEVVLGALLGALIASMFGLWADAVRRRWQRDDKHLERLQQRAEIAGDELLGALAEMRSRLQAGARPDDEPEDLSDLTGLLRRRSQLIPNPEVRRRLVLIARCADEWWGLRSFHGAAPWTVAALEEYASLNEEVRREEDP